jgi:predicted RNase H-like nuclease (RuvC/YqgF family)
MFKPDLDRWLARELRLTERTILEAEDELANAQLRVEALKRRLTRLKGHQRARALPDGTNVTDLPPHRRRQLKQAQS